MAIRRSIWLYRNRLVFRCGPGKPIEILVEIERLLEEEHMLKQIKEESNQTRGPIKEKLKEISIPQDHCLILTDRALDGRELGEERCCSKETDRVMVISAL